MTSVVPPHKAWESSNPVLEAFKIEDKDARDQAVGRWYDALDAMLPSHTYSRFGERTWTTPAGMWRVVVEPSGWNYPKARVGGPGVQVDLSDINIEHIRSVLTVLGAIAPQAEELPS